MVSPEQGCLARDEPVVDLARPDPDGQRRSLRQLVERAAARISRFSAQEAFATAAEDGVMIDIRSREARAERGVIPGSLHIPRTVLEWRVALDSPWRSPYLGGWDQRLILICDHGCSSILAASNLVELGFDQAGDVIGGFDAWIDMALPVARYREHSQLLEVPPTALPNEVPEANTQSSTNG